MALTMKKGDTVLLHAFTGMKLGPKEVISADKTTITISTNKGELTFSRKTGKQVDPEPKEPRYASFITEDDGSFVPPSHKRKPAAKAKKKPEPEEEFDEEEFEEEEPEEEPKKKSTSKKSTAKKKPEPEPEEEDWEEDFEDIEEVED